MANKAAPSKDVQSLLNVLETTIARNPVGLQSILNKHNCPVVLTPENLIYCGVHEGKAFASDLLNCAANCQAVNEQDFTGYLGFTSPEAPIAPMQGAPFNSPAPTVQDVINGNVSPSVAPKVIKSVKNTTAAAASSGAQGQGYPIADASSPTGSQSGDSGSSSSFLDKFNTVINDAGQVLGIVKAAENAATSATTKTPATSSGNSNIMVFFIATLAVIFLLLIVYYYIRKTK
jgi:cobalamin biosynthesis Mg chelatase CobN